MAQCGFAARTTSIKRCMSRCSYIVPSRFEDESKKQGENAKGRPIGSISQLAECSHGKRKALGLSPGRATIFVLPCDFSIVNDPLPKVNIISLESNYQSYLPIFDRMELECSSLVPMRRNKFCIVQKSP